MSVSRREFIASSAAAAAVAACGPSGSTSGADPARSPGKQPQPEPAKLDLLILGGTGFLGPHVVKSALDRGHTVTLFNRGKSDPTLFPDLETLIGDRDGKLDALRDRRWHGVVDTSGYVPRIVKQSAELLAPNVELYLFVSTISVYQESPRSDLDESAPLLTMPDETSEDVPKFYGALKALCEKAARDATAGRACVVRPGLIVGPRDQSDRYTYWPARLAAGGDVLAPGDGKDQVQIIDARDLAAFMVHGLEKRLSETYNLVGPKDDLLWQPFLEQTRAGVGSNAKLIWVNEGFLEKHKIAPWMDLPAWIPRGKPESGLTALSNARAVAAGATFRSVGDIASDTLAWWNQLPEERRTKPRAGITREREAQVLAAWKSAG